MTENTGMYIYDDADGDGFMIVIVDNAGNEIARHTLTLKDSYNLASLFMNKVHQDWLKPKT